VKHLHSANLFRLASILTFLFCLGHSAGYPWTPSLGTGESLLIEGMRAQRFEVMGESRTYWDFYLGFGLINSVYLTAVAIFLWLFGEVAKANNGIARVAAALSAVIFLANAYLCWRFFFAPPFIFSLGIAASLVGAFVAKPARSP
jgi:hypothetical protein